MGSDGARLQRRQGSGLRMLLRAVLVVLAAGAVVAVVALTASYVALQT